MFIYVQSISKGWDKSKGEISLSKKGLILVHQLYKSHLGTPST